MYSSRGVAVQKGLILYCNKCKTHYNLNELAEKAERDRKWNLYCPNCGKRIGRLQ